MRSGRFRLIGGVIAINLGLFVAVTSLPAFRAAHHHWIFPLLSGLLAGQWALSLISGAGRLIDTKAARTGILSSLSLILVMGVVRHATILACFDHCGFKLGGAAAMAAVAFLGQRRLDEPGPWNRLRSGLAATGSLLWALYLTLRGLSLAPWILNLGFAVIALLFWLGRRRALFLMTALGVVAALAIRATADEYWIIGLTALLIGAAFGSARRVESWLLERASRRSQALVAQTAPRWRALHAAARVAAAVAIVAALGFYAIGPVFLMTNPAQRQERLAKLAPSFPIQDPRTLSPLASRLRGHVQMLAGTIGERDAFQRAKQEQAQDYVMRQFKAAGYSPQALAYESRWLAGVKNGTRFANVEALLPARPADAIGVWILGAHYDSAPGTPGADDNASGVAVLLETARLLRPRRPAREIRFVAFGTEEPPAFGTRNMGSHRYAERLKDRSTQVLGMISLEMLGYYNPRPGSQLYPPFLQLFYPDHGGYVGAVGNLESRRLLASFKTAWQRGSRFPLTTAVLPGPFSGLALSDQLNFWDRGYPALMLSDTAFYRNPHYHEAGDLADTLDYERMAEVTRALAAAIALETGR